MDFAAQLQAMQAEHERAQVALKQETDQARRAAVAATEQLTDVLVTSVNTEVARAFERQKQLEAEARALQLEAAKFHRHTAQWAAAVKALDASLKEIGDFQNWVGIIEGDMQIVLEGLQRLSAAEPPPSVG